MKKNKIGRLTTGIFFILLGIGWLFHNWYDLSFLKIISYLWPFIFISLGAEVLYQHGKKEVEEKLTFDHPAIILLFIVMLISGGLFSFKGINISGGITVFGDNWKSSMAIEEVYAADLMDSALFEFTNGNITVIGSETDEISIKGIVKSNLSDRGSMEEEYEKNRQVEESGKAFSYSVKDTGNSFFFSNKNMQYDLTITVPTSISVEIDSLNGSIDANDLTNDVDLSTTNGNIRLLNVGGQTSVRSTNGSLNVENVSGDLNAVTTNGAIEINSETVVGDWKVETVNGRIRIQLPKDASVHIEAETTNGKVDGNFSWERDHEGQLMKENTQGSAILNEGTYQIIAKGINGSIHIYQD